MKWLLWREYRLNRLILISGDVFFLLPYGIIGLNVLAGSYRPGDLVGAWMASGIAAYLLIALLAGNAIAGERADRSAEFIAYVLLSPWRIVGGKLLFALIVFAPAWCVTRVVVDHLILPQENAHVFLDLRPFVVNILLIYGVGWLFTSCLSSATFASVIGFSAPCLIHFSVVAFLARNGNLGEESLRLIKNPDRYGEFVFWYVMFWVPVAILCFGIGTWNYLRRSKT
jgi:hypothetical protein